MAFLDQAITLDSLPVSERGGFEPLPAGWYTARISSTEVRPTKSGSGKYIAIRYDITGPTHQGRVVFGNLNIRNANPVAERIGKEQLGELMRAIGLAQMTDTDQLVGADLSIKLKVRADDGYEPTNDVGGFKAIGNNIPRQASAPAAMPAATHAQAAPAATGKASPPWAKQ